MLLVFFLRFLSYLLRYANFFFLLLIVPLGTFTFSCHDDTCHLSENG